MFWGLILKNKFKTFFISFLGGILYSFGFPSFISYQETSLILSNLGLFIFIFQLPFPFVIKSKENEIKFKIFALSLISFSIGFNTFGFYWIPETLKLFGDINFPFNFILSQLFSLFILPHYWVYLLFLFIIFKFKKKFFNSIENSNFLVNSIPLFLALLLTLLENIVPQQFPAHIGHTWLKLKPYLSYAPYFGSPIYSFISYLLIFGIIQNLKFKKDNKFFSLNPSIVLALILITGNFFKPLKNTSALEAEKKINIRIVQANIGNFLKSTLEKQGHINNLNDVINKYRELSLKDSNLISFKPDLIIWPETAFPFTFSTLDLINQTVNIPDQFQKIKNKFDAHLLIGGYDSLDINSRNDFENVFNAAIFLDLKNNKSNVYHKHLLIPFGETLPFGNFLNKIIGEYIDNISYFATGETFPIFETKWDTQFSVAICYEILFFNFIRSYLNAEKSKQPDFLINLTNDSWYGQTAEPDQHLFLTKWRALEFQLPVIRSTNTGISTIIYPDGRESDRILLDTEGILDVKLSIPTESKPTLFQKYGLTGLLMVVLFLFLPFYLLYTYLVRTKL
jgi:apolipoprotein N-acyltransferase